MDIKIPHSFLEINYTYYIKEYNGQDLDFNIHKYNQIKKLLIEEQNKNIQIKISKRDELIKKLKEHGFDFKNYSSTFIFNAVNNSLKGDLIDSSIFERILNYKKVS